MAQIDGQPDHAAPEPVLETEGFSPKMIAAAVWAFCMPFLLDGAAELVAYIAGNPHLLDALPWWVRVPVTAIVSSLAIALAAFRAKPGQIQVRAPQAR